MRRVAAYLQAGRVGHQFSQLFSARYFSELYKYEYLHTDFIDGEQWGDKAAIWNDFLQLGKDAPRLEDYIHWQPAIQVTRPLPPRPPSRLFEWQREHFDNISRCVPDEWLLLFPDYGILWYDVYHWDREVFSRTADWFQRQVFASRAYRACPVIRNSAASKLRVVGYLRRGGNRGELPDPWYIPDDRFLSQLWALRHQYGSRMGKPVVFSQGPRETLTHPGWDAVDVHICDDEYPATFTAMKTCIEADIFVGSTGATTAMIRTLRHNRRVSLGVFKERTASVYPDGPYIDRVGRLIEQEGELCLP